MKKMEHPNDELPYPEGDTLSWLEQVWIEVQNEIDYETKHPQPNFVLDALERADQEERLARFHSV